MYNFRDNYYISALDYLLVIVYSPLVFLAGTLIFFDVVVVVLFLLALGILALFKCLFICEILGYSGFVQ